LPPEELQARVGGPLDFTREAQALYLRNLRQHRDQADGRLAGRGLRRRSRRGDARALSNRAIPRRIYNPGGTLSPGEVTFPYSDDQFEFAFLMSVFTHILKDGFERYCAEISRVLRPRRDGGGHFLPVQRIEARLPRRQSRASHSVETVHHGTWSHLADGTTRGTQDTVRAHKSKS
jgi:SAM-dependent methyltransferase